MVAVLKYLVSETTCFLVTHSGISFLFFLDGFPLELFTFDLQSFWKLTLFPKVLQITFDLSDDPPSEPLPFPLLCILKSTIFKSLLNELSITTVCDFCINGWSLHLSFLSEGSHFFGFTSLQYLRVSYCTRYS